jgi:PPM family protein phosphatase
VKRPPIQQPVLRASGVSDKGRARRTNEDCFAIREDLGLCVVADGMGGHKAGEVAARIAVDAVVDFLSRWSTTPSGERSADAAALHPFGLEERLSPSANALRTAILLANADVLEAAGSADRFAGMGTTVVAARVSEGRLAVAHVGDSRLYLLLPEHRPRIDDQRATTNDQRPRLRQLTHDDSWVASMLEQDPHADAALLQHHPMRNALTNVVGARQGTDVHVVEEALAGGELLLLSTDGVHGVLDASCLERLMTLSDDLQAIADGLLAAALSRGSRDNCTVVVARYA